MTSQNIKDRSRQFVAALHAIEQQAEGAIETMVALFSDDARISNAALKLAGEERSGHAGVREFWTEYRRTFREVQTEFYTTMGHDCATGLFWTTRGVDVLGQPVEYDGASLLVFDDDGKIMLFRGYYDTRELSRKVAA